ncbi:hypothetical protein [Mycoplasma sp. P36-A1]|uniref:hypothetical protein n=1 Tax=Mycoplasma sp. P36-A1 TaxID=3252900 RepID=UPI003C30EAAC
MYKIYRSDMQLRKYFLFNYGNHYRRMLDYNLIGIDKLPNKDLSIVFNAADPKEMLADILKEQHDISNEDKTNFEKFLFEMEVGDAVCLVDSKSVRAVGIIESNYRFNKNKEVPHVRAVKWLNKETMSIEDGNHRIKIRQVEKQSTHEMIEQVINEALVSDDNGMLINYPSFISTDEYLTFFENVTFNPHEIELLHIIYKNQDCGISIYELQKQYVGIRVKESLENLARKISRQFKLKKVEGMWTPNLFNGIVRDGHLCLIMKNELATALKEAGLIHEDQLRAGSKYTLAEAATNSVYTRGYFEEALRLIEMKKTLHIVGDWGTGKSYFARKLAYLVLEDRNLDNMLHIKMTKNMTYEVLMDEKTGLLYNFIEMARKNTMDNFVIIFEDAHSINIDDVAAEISYLMEDNNRAKESALDVPYSPTKYYLPDNIYILMTYRDVPGMFNPYEISNNLIFEMNAMYNDRFIHMFEDHKLASFIAKTFTELNQELQDYGLTINHGLFLKKDRGINIDEYKTVVKYKLMPIFKRVMDNSDYEQALAKIKSFYEK